MQQERKQLEELFHKYQQGAVTEEEKTLIARWLIKLDIYGQLTPEQLQAKRELSLGDLKNHFFPEETPRAKTIRFPAWIRSVAACLFVLIAIAGIFYFKKNSHQQLFNPTAFLEIKTGKGEMKVITLTDGSKITLNNESRLKYPVAFNGKAREVFLTGEAFFEVAHDPVKPFNVHTDQLNVQVLGTSFNVKAYHEDKEQAVSVATGKVGVIATVAKIKTYMLLPGDQLAYNRYTGKFVHSITDVTMIRAWQNGRFVFRNETLKNITRQLARYYNVKFIFNSKLLSARQLSLSVKNQSIGTVMKTLSISGEFRYKTESNKITIW